MTKMDNSGRRSSDGISLGIHPECLFFLVDFMVEEDFLKIPCGALRFLQSWGLTYCRPPVLKIVASLYCHHLGRGTQLDEKPSMGPRRSDEPEHTTEGSSKTLHSWNLTQGRRARLGEARNGICQLLSPLLYVYGPVIRYSDGILQTTRKFKLINCVCHLPTIAASYLF